MDELRLNRKDGWFILICLIVLAGGVVVGLKYFKKAFPEASIDFRYNRGDTEQIAVNYLQAQGLTPAKEFRHASRFGYDDDAKTYLEKELGVEGARPFLGHPVRLWYWMHRWFKPSTKEEYRVFVTPEGDVVMLNHMIEEQAEGADLSQDSARVIASAFLFGPMKEDSSKLAFMEAKRTGRPHRADWEFTWRAKGIEPVKDSEYRYQITVTGDKIAGYREFLHVPEKWEQSYGRLRSFNEMAGQFSGVGLLLTGIGMIVILFLRLRKKQVQWKTAIWFGVVACALTLLNQINDFPVTLYGYDTTSSWPGFLTQAILGGILETFGAGLGIFLLTAAAETMYREKYGTMMALPRTFTVTGLRTKYAFKSILLGVTLTSFFFAYQIAFYLIAGHLGAWSPSEVPYDDLLNTAMPWLAVLAIGFFPAVTEEFISRAFSIAFLQKIFKNRYTWLAIVIPAFIWGFGHSTYPNEPFYIRGLEVGMAGIVIGVIMLRFGILTTLVWHYTVDALYTAMLLFRSHNAYFVLTAAVATGILVIPLLAALIAYLRKGTFLPETGLRNADISGGFEVSEPETAPAEARPEEVTVTYVRLPSSRRMLAIVLLAAGIGASFIPVAKLGDFVEFPVSKEDAIKIVQDSVRAIGWAKPDTLQWAAFPDDGGDWMSQLYILQHVNSIERYNRIAEDTLGLGRWRVQAWVPENRLRYYGMVNSRTAKIEYMSAMLPEEMPGDSMPQDSAEAMVVKVLTARGEDTTKLVLKDAQQEAKPHRLDYYFSFEAKDGDPRNIAEAKYRRSGQVDGHYLTVNRRAWYKLPETWVRAYRATTSLRAVRRYIPRILQSVLAIWAVALLILRMRKGLVPWKKALVMAILPTLILLVSNLNDFYDTQGQYFWNIEQPWGVFRTTVITQWLISGVMGYVLFALAFAFMSGLFAEKLESLRSHERRVATVDAFVTVIAAIGAVLLWKNCGAWLTAWHPAWLASAGFSIPPPLGDPVPITSVFSWTINRAAITTVMIGSFAYLWSGSLRKPLLRVLMVLGILVMSLSSGAQDPPQWLLSAMNDAVGLLAVWVVMRFIVAGRAVLFVSAVVGYAVFQIASACIGAGNGELTVQTWIFVVMAALLFYTWLRFSRRTASA